MIRKGFQRTDFLKRVEVRAMDQQTEEGKDNVEEMWRVLCSKLQINLKEHVREFLTFDDGVATNEVISEEEIMGEILHIRTGTWRLSTVR